MHFPPVSDFPLFSTNFQTLWKISKMLPFTERNFDFSSAKISLMTFLVIERKFQISPYFPCFRTCPPCFEKLLFPPTFKNAPLCFRKIHLVFTYFMCISFPTYFDRDAASPNAGTGHPWIGHRTIVQIV